MQQIRARVHHLLDRRKILGTAAFNHVASKRKGRSGKADQRNSVVELAANHTHGFGNVTETFFNIGNIQGVDSFFALHGLGKDRTFTGNETQTKPHRIGHSKNVREKNSGIQTITIYRLQRHRIRTLGQSKERPEARTRGVVFRQIAAGLTHQPQRGIVGMFALERSQKSVVDRFHGKKFCTKRPRKHGFSHTKPLFLVKSGRRGRCLKRSRSPRRQERRRCGNL